MYKIKLSPYANTFYTEWLLDRNSYRYNLVIDQILHGDLDIQRLRMALKRYVAEYLLLNSHIQEINEMPHWVKNPDITELEYSDNSNSVDSRSLLNYVMRGFDLFTGPLYRFKLLRVGGEVYRLVIVFHHIVMDGSSKDTDVFEIISNYYNDETYAAKYDIDDQIKLVANLTETLFNKLEQNRGKYKEFWTKQLADVEMVDLGFLKLGKDDDKRSLSGKCSPIGEIRFSYDGVELAKLNQIKRKHIVTPYIYSLCIFALLINRYTGKERFVISYVTSIKEGVDVFYGAQVNTNFIPYKFDQSITFVDLFNQSKVFFKSLKQDNYNYSYYPVADIIQEGGKNLLNLYFAQPNLKYRVFTFVGITRVEVSNEFDLDSVDPLIFEQAMGDEGRKLNYRVRYDKKVINEELINNFVYSFKKLFLEVLEDLLSEKNDKQISSYSPLDLRQYHKIVYEFNQTEKNYPRDKTIHKLFEEQAQKTPHDVALVYEDEKLTYEELNEKSNRLARYLREQYNQLTQQELKPDTLISLCLDRSCEMIIAILAVLKSGGAYVPIDPDYPSERIRYVLEDTKTAIIITQESVRKKLEALIMCHKKDKKLSENKSIKLLVIDNQLIWQEFKALLSADNLKSINQAKDLAYVIYTSGTTGKPKGVMVGHEGVINTVLSLYKTYDFSRGNKSLAFSSYTFDVSVSEFFVALLRGGELHLLNEGSKKDASLVSDYINNQGINYIYLPPAMLSVFPRLEYKTLQGIIYAGEPCDKETGKYWSNKYALYNYYGPTEATIYATGKRIRNGDVHLIGSPISNTKCYILDKNLLPLPIGVVGELYIGGVGVARGYLNHDKDELAKSFIGNPFQTSKEKAENINNRLYKTGDLVRILPDGNIEFIGRNDYQVKIRGFRVELGEVENSLLSYPQIKQAAVIVKEKKNNRLLVAYYASDNKLDHSKLHDYMLSRLPDYMIPNVFIYMQNLPLMDSGKINRKLLPKPVLTKKSRYVSPRNELEKKVCRIYAEVLNLPTQRVGITSDFFEIGGDSISSIQIILRVKQQLGLVINVADVFNQRNVGQLVANVLTNQNLPKENTREIREEDDDEIINLKYLKKVQKGEKVENIYLANNLQQGFIYHTIRQGKIDDAYISQFVWKYTVPIDRSKFKMAWQLAQKKYPSLRLRFAWDEEVIQIVDKDQELDFRYVDLGNLHEEIGSEYRSQITSILNQDRQERYDLCQGNLIRIYLVKLSKNGYICICSVHHIILDGWSSSLLLDSVHEIYLQLLDNRRPKITEDVAYKKAQKYLQGHRNEDLEYWNGWLRHLEDRVDLKSLLKPQAKDIEIKNHLRVEQEQEQHVEITWQNLRKLKNVCQTNAVTINAVIQYVWHKVLYVYGTSNTTVVGAVISGRKNIPVANIEKSVGLYINTLPLMYLHTNELTLIEQIKTIQDTIGEINSKSNVNLANLQSEGERLFDSLIIYENYPSPKRIVGMEYRDMREIGKVDYPLAIIAYERGQNLTIKLEYAGELFDKETISQLLNKMVFFIEQISEDPYKTTLSYLSREEYQRLIIDYNKTEKYYPANKTIYQLFEEQVLETPSNVALVCEGKKLTYEELNNKANQLANYILRNHDIRPDDLIALILDRNEYIIISILAVLKTGAAYVPIDPSYPNTRIKYLLEDAKTKVVIEGKNNEYKAQGCGVVKVDSNELQQVLSKESIFNPRVNVFGRNLIYVIYTSGTTGNPKGVAVEHHSVVNYVLYLIDYHRLNSKSIGSQCAQFGFDMSVTETYPILLSGGVLHLMPDEDKFDPGKVNDFFYKNHITYAFLPTKLAEFFFELKNTTLVNLVVEGEKLEKFVTQPYRVINGYGPTETTVQVTGFVVDKAYDNIPIGRPISNVKCYVVDNNLNPLPVYVIGELVIGGEVLARGYYERPQITAEKFVANPFQTSEEKAKNKNNRLYKTGDMVRMLPDGNIEYIGRHDFQVKIKGHRIEFGEIEGKLVNYPEVRQAVVIVNEVPNNKCLVAYYVADKKLDEKKVEDYLRQQLPDYMIPDTFIYIQKLPLTKNGKLDRKALPELGFVDEGKYSAPKNEQERLICETFADILELQKVGVEDDFFSLGGNSILAISLASRLQTNFDVKIAGIFELRTPKKIAQNSMFGRNFLQHRLDQVKRSYIAARNDSKLGEVEPQQEPQAYLQSIKDLPLDMSLKKPIHNILLTGATGYLGCNILNQLLELTDYKIYLPIRAISQTDTVERINKKYQFYFNKRLDEIINTRIFVFKADIEQEHLALSPIDYQDLATKIDSVIHAAALVKHYGEYDEFYSANVKATINLLEFAKLTKLKDLHYISTKGVLTYLPILNAAISCCTEDDLPIPSEILNNVYAQTKLLGEHQVTKYQNLGLNCNIYRIGNLAFMLKDCRTQENVEDNAFYNWLKCLMTIKRSAEVINTVEISPTDLTAQAIVKIFDKEFLSNQTYHVFNPDLFDISSVLKNKGFRILPIEAFIDGIAQYIEDDSCRNLVVKFLLHQGWMDWWEERNMSPIKISQNKTQYVLEKLGFKWFPITEEVLYNYFVTIQHNSA